MAEPVFATTPASALLLTLTLPFLPALFRAWPAAVRCSPRLQTPSPIVRTPSHSLEPHNLVHLRRRRWPAARHPPHTAALLMASRKQDAQPNPIDARTLRTIERVAPQAPEEMLTLTNPTLRCPALAARGPGAVLWHGCGQAIADVERVCAGDRPLGPEAGESPPTLATKG